MKSIGFTGTQRGMTTLQSRTVHDALKRLCWAGSHFHDGMCEGADHEAAHLAYNAGYILIGHPGPRPDPFAIKHKEVREPLPNLERNRIIVAESHYLIAAPFGDEEIHRSGTWATVRYARKAGVPALIVWPDGSYDWDFPL